MVFAQAGAADRGVAATTTPKVASCAGMRVYFEWRNRGHPAGFNSFMIKRNSALT